MELFKRKKASPMMDVGVNAPQTTHKIGANEVRRASEILRKYKDGKLNLERRIIENEEFWKLKQWRYENNKASANGKSYQPSTAWLWSCIQSRHSDCIDSYPTCNYKPRSEEDKAEAERLSAIIPVILEQNRYEDVYSDVVWYVLKHGGVAQGIFWDGSAHNGLGDISIKKIDLLNLFWQPGVTDIQESQNVFNIELVDNNVIEQRFPQTAGRLGGKNFNVARYMYDDKVDITEKSVVVDWYYHTYHNGRKVLQYCKYVNDIVLFASENETTAPTKTVIDPSTNLPVDIPTGEPMSVRGFYDHGLYPFVVTSLYPVEGSICGYGLTDIGRDTQVEIDILNKAICENARKGAKPRFFVVDDGTINLDQYNDENVDFVKVEGNIGDERIRPIEHKALDGIYINFLQQKIDELKFITSNQDVNNGAAPSGVTSASGIAALQESSGKNARTTNKNLHRSYRDVCYQVVELVRQFYDFPRTFRINPSGTRDEFVKYSNAGLKAQPQFTNGMDMGLRLPEFDIEITSEKANPYKKMEMNDLAMTFYNSGIFNPEMTTQALSMLEMMDFTHKDEVISKVKENGTLYEMLLLYQQLSLELAKKISPEEADLVAQQINSMLGGSVSIPTGESEVVSDDSKEHPFVERSRETARQSTQVD